MNDDLFLEGAVERYKGFLHLIKRNTENKMKQFCVPTYDIDLIWHSHQLHPVSYCKDLITVLGKVLDHNDMDSDRTKGEKLNVGFTETTKQWEETFGSRYWRAGAMYRGSAPSPLVTDVFSFETLRKEVIPSIDFENTMQLPQKMLVEIFLEIVGVRNLPAGHKGSLFVSVSKSQPDVFFKTKRRLIIMSSEPGEKQVIAFHCEPTGELAFELVSYYSPSSLHTTSSPEILGTTSIPIQDLLNPISKLRIEKWFDLVATTTSQVSSSQSIGLRVALSLTAPIQAPYLLHMVRGHPFSTTSSFPLPQRVQLAKSWMCIIDEAGNEIISIQMRDTNKSEANSNGTFKKEIIGLTRSGETRLLAELLGEKWYLIGSQWSLQVQKKISEEDSTFELIGSRKMTIFQGRKLEYETKDCKRKKNERDFMTIVEFSNEDPYGKAVALLDLKSGFLKVEEQWFALPGITIAFILSGILMKEGYGKPEDDCVCSGECDNRNGTIKKAFLTREYEWTGASACGGGCGGSCGGSCGGACRGGSCGGGRCGGGCKS